MQSKLIRIFFLVVVSILALTLVGCGGGNESASSDQGGQTASSSSSDSNEKSSNKGEGDSEEKLSIRLATNGGKGNMLRETSYLYAEKVKEMSDGKIEIKVFDNSQLGKDTAVLSMAKQGSLELVTVSSTMVSLQPKFGVFDIPFLFADRSKVAQIAHGEIWNEDLKPLLHEEGLVGLVFAENGFRQIINNERPIHEPADLEGLKFRVPGSQTRIAMFEALGANPSPLDWSEVFTALQQGVFDGAEAPLPAIKGQKLEEVSKYVSLSNHVYSPAYISASKVWFDKLTPEQQEILVEAGKIVGDESRKLGKKLDEKFLEQFKEAGVEVNKVNSEAFRDKTKTVIDVIKEEIDPAFVDKVLKAAE